MNVIAHCKDGDKKSAAIVIAYVMYKFKIGWEKGYELVKAKRPCVNLSQEIVEQLKSSE